MIPNARSAMRAARLAVRVTRQYFGGEQVMRHYFSRLMIAVINR